MPVLTPAPVAMAAGAKRIGRDHIGGESGRGGFVQNSASARPTSKDAGYVNGTVIPVDGGAVAAFVPAGVQK